jgi:hypothetical protein
MNDEKSSKEYYKGYKTRQEKIEVKKTRYLGQNSI